MILVTGGLGYIGSHFVVEALLNRQEVVILDDLSNSRLSTLNGIFQITGIHPKFVQGSILDCSLVSSIFSEYKIDSVIHFAGLKSVSESVTRPLAYYQVNVVGTLNLLECMKAAEVFNLVFSSSATVYGDPESVPITESFETGVTTNPYGASKHIVERVLLDIVASDDLWNIVVLRYFNPIGAHQSGIIGELPNSTPANLLPYVLQVATGGYSHVNIYGSDYPTKDGTGVRDYIHVVDLVIGHLQALKFLGGNAGCNFFNLGTGVGYSVLEVIDAVKKVTKKPIAYSMVARRAGDIAECFADVKRAKDALSWTAKKSLDIMIADAWRWHLHSLTL